MPNPVVQSSTRLVTKDFSGDALIIGAVQNAWRAGVATFIKINVNLFGAGGRFLGTDFTFVQGMGRRLSQSRIITDTTLAGGETGCFVMFTNIPKSRVKRIQTTTNFDAGGTERLKGKIRLRGNLLLEPDFSGDLQVSGRLRNASNRLTYFNQINLDVRAATGQIIDCDFTFVNGSSVRLSSGVTTDTALRPGEVGSFKTFGRPPFTQVDSVRQWRTWDEADTPAVLTTLEAMDDAYARALAADYLWLWTQMGQLQNTDFRTVTQRDRVTLRNQLLAQAKLIEEYLSGP